MIWYKKALFALLYGSLAVRIGKKAVMFLSCIGIILRLFWIVGVSYLDDVFPAEAIWISSIFIFIGGGPRVNKAMSVSMVSDVLHDKNRTKFLYILASIAHINKIIGPVVGALLMGIDIYLPFAVGLGLWVLSLLLIPFLPREAVHKDDAAKLSSEVADETQPLLQEVHEDERLVATDGLNGSKRTVLLSESFRLFAIPGLALVFMLFTMNQVAIASEKFIPQYASEILHWPLKRTTWFRVSQAIAASFLTLVFFPILTSFITRKHYSPQKWDIMVIRISLLVLASGFFATWRADSAVVLGLASFLCGLGTGLEPALQGLGASLISREDGARLFTMVATLDTAGDIVAGPTTASLFRIGKFSGGVASEGYNFLVSGVSRRKRSSAQDS
jgi:MFS family permease